MKKFLFFTAVVILGVCFSCSKESVSEDISGDNYNRSAMLTNWANNIIIPRYENYQSKVNTLDADVIAFNTNPTQVTLDNLRTSWLNAYKAYQYVGMFTIGKAEEIQFVNKVNTYPTNTTTINSNLSSGTYNFELLSQYDAQGFPALDYMLHGVGTSDTEILDFYVSNVNATNNKQYLTALSTQLKNTIATVLTDWNTNFATNFIASNGNSVSSSVNIMVNNFIKYYEKNIRAGKVGIPAGIYSSNVKFPEKVEAFYNANVSKTLLNEAIIATQDFYNGKGFTTGTEGQSLKSYLDFLNTVRGGQQLSNIINNQFSTIYATNGQLNDNFASQVTTDNTKMIASFDAMQQNVVYFKLDMMQALNIVVAYTDADGD